MLRGITFVAVPMINPDGGELNRRQNHLLWAEVVEDFPQLAGAPPAWSYSRGAGGFDVNRDFHTNLAYEPRAEDLPGADELPGFYLTPESRACSTATASSTCRTTAGTTEPPSAPPATPGAPAPG